MEVKKNCPPLPPRPITPARTYPVLSAVEIAPEDRVERGLYV